MGTAVSVMEKAAQIILGQHKALDKSTSIVLLAISVFLTVLRTEHEGADQITSHLYSTTDLLPHKPSVDTRNKLLLERFQGYPRKKGENG